HSGADAIRNAYARVGIPSQYQARQFLAKCIDPLKPIKMPDGVLRHSAVPTMKRNKERVGGDSEHAIEIVTDNFNDCLVIQLHVIVCVGAAEEATDQSRILRRPKGKLVMNKRRGQNFYGLIFGHKKSEAWRQRRADVLIEGQGDSNR